MSHKLNGMINLAKIPRELIHNNKNGEPCVYIDVLANRNGVDQYGNSHSVSVYDKNTRKAVYLGNLKTVEFGQKDDGDLPPDNAGKEKLPWE